jgi:hypothetical protein
MVPFVAYQLAGRGGGADAKGVGAAQSGDGIAGCTRNPDLAAYRRATRAGPLNPGYAAAFDLGAQAHAVVFFADPGGEAVQQLAALPAFGREPHGAAPAVHFLFDQRPAARGCLVNIDPTAPIDGVEAGLVADTRDDAAHQAGMQQRIVERHR